MEFDIVMKSRGLTFENRMDQKVAGNTPATMYLASRLEAELPRVLFPRPR
jgi:hypothetical protein